MRKAPCDLQVRATVEDWPLSRPFVISRGAKSAARVVVAQVDQGGATGRGEAVPYARYGESVSTVLEAVRAQAHVSSRDALQLALPAGAGRNALDCALWDLEAKLAGTRVGVLAGLGELSPVLTAFTISLGPASEMADQARAASRLTLLKLKLGTGLDDIARMRAVRAARPDARLIADANEGWTASQLNELLACAADLDFETVEQPLNARADSALYELDAPLSICADESVHTCDDLEGLIGRYDAVNIKLDKAGGLTHALEMVEKARALNFKVMVGSMVATSLAVAPALLLAQNADWVDLDGPLLLKTDRPHGLEIEDGMMSPPSPELWG